MLAKGATQPAACKPDDSLLASASQLLAADVGSKVDDDVCLHCSAHVVAEEKCKLQCMSCRKTVHTACVIKQFNAKCGTAFRNSISWMHEFICTVDFRFNCGSCGRIAHPSSSFQQSIDVHAKSAIDDLRRQICDVCQLVDALHKEVVSKLEPLLIVAPSVMHPFPKQIRLPCLQARVSINKLLAIYRHIRKWSVKVYPML